MKNRQLLSFHVFPVQQHDLRCKPARFKLCIALLLLLSTTALPVSAQLLARISVKAGARQCVNVPVSTIMKDVVIAIQDSLQFFEIQQGRRTPVPLQVSGGYLYWIMDGKTAPGKIRTYELSKGSPVPAIARMQAKDSAGALVLEEGKQHLLQYNYNIVEPPAGVDTVYRRSGFIHPLWAPDGQVITNIHPEGHWHHVGIWNPWTHTSFKGKETDFWNLHKKEGTVRFKGFISRTQGPVWCGFQALHDHIAFSGKQETVAINEEWDVKAFNSDGNTSRIWDIDNTMSCADTAGITFLQYRYGGGFGLRTTAEWKAANSKVLTSEGKTRKDADSTRARWIKITGRTDKGEAGILVMSHPSNYDYPQPVRVWPENNERGEIMMNFSPTKMKPWQLKYGQTYRLCYRVIVFTNDLSKEEAEEAWEAYAKPPQVTVSWSAGL
ncbi:PmoA family protein [Chitinophaga filiformis]|uniref:DUF6807 domain-containing protein n=1 Tax=Chitinophaga filiformis TaxID=104663 RepID=UPI001F16F59F|nr:PmoA family protein [Chitinophaga filiformis]MCF6402697.1 PmoA family protein [Chitinophaga filiformis]MCF6403385.1 PmoA family protein [Chitinophaga filiformis]